MALFPHKGFCLWLVPAADGKVRKIRFTTSKAIIVSILGLTVLGAVGYVATDYSRVQLLRLKSLLSVKRLTAEKDNLASANQEILSELESMKALNEKVLTHQRGVKQRLDELKSVLNFASGLGVLEQDGNSRVPRLLKEDGVGGAEIDCESPELCKGLAAIDPIPQLNDASMTSDDLIRTLDYYIETLRSLPLQVPANGYVTSTFGYRRSPFARNKVKMHQGVDFSLSLGSTVFASADGVIKDVKRTSTYGLMIDISHGKNVVTRYAHLSKAVVKVGERVCAGEVVGLAGSTGHSTGPHLHYEVLVNNHQQNPMKFFDLAKQIAAFIES